MIKIFYKLLLVISLSNVFSSSAADVNYNYNYDAANLSEDVNCNDIADPFESINRKIFFFNAFLDMILLKPIVVVYDKGFNSFSKSRVGDFVDNVYEPLTAVNFVLQMDAKYAFRSVAKFFLNSTFGLFGLFDVGSKMGLNHTPQNFGSTLARYGARSGPYLVLPLIGSTNMRDMFNSAIFDDALNPIKYNLKSGIKYTYTAVRVIQKRQEVLPFTNYIAQTSSDPYVSLRSAYHQNRENQLKYPKGYKCGVKAKKN
ncbi:MAG: VacJ family lipoprotein [Rickettsiaceae bacterium]|nr:VacJ family lipoprotein [Rickettsiaceae bacterium]